MRRLPLVCLGLAIAAASGYVLATVEGLPDPVATHFGGSGAPDAWLTRPAYTLGMLFFVTAFPLLMVAAIGGVPRLLPGLVSLPNRDYWLSPGRRRASLEYLTAHACWLGCLITLTAAAIHGAILDAHHREPVRLDNAAVLTIVVVFLLAEIGWIALLWRRFRRRR
jgi:uncharacterized membrane protein